MTNLLNLRLHKFSYLFTVISQGAHYYYLRQVNGVNGRGTVFVRCVCVCVCVHVRTQQTGQSDQFIMVKATAWLKI